MGSPLSLDKFTIFDFQCRCSSEQESIKFAQEIGVLCKSISCHCGRVMKLYERPRKIDGCSFRCTHCYNEISVKHASWLNDRHHARISVKIFLHILFFWSKKISVTASSELIGVQKETIVNYFNMFREECGKKLITMPVQLGGPGKIVEIDETFLGAERKYGRGAEKERKGDVFGAFERESGQVAMIYIGGKSHIDLIPTILKWILPGTTICSDGLATYKCLGNLGYNHHSVNHSIGEYVRYDGSLMVTTNGIEGAWGNLKMRFQAMHGTKAEMMPSYIDEFIWRRRFKPPLDNFISMIQAPYGESVPKLLL